MNCSECQDFYIGKTIRTLKQRLSEHAKDENNALTKHYAKTGHEIDFSNPLVVASDRYESRLFVKKTLFIRDLSAHLSLNGNIGSQELKLW